MNEDNLTKLVEQLDAQISRAKSLSSVDRELLGNLRRDIDEVLARSRAKSPSDEHVLGDLRTATERFESTHPDLAAAMAQIVDLLTKLGI
jgi:hypothetical protein